MNDNFLAFTSSDAGGVILQASTFNMNNLANFLAASILDLCDKNDPFRIEVGFSEALDEYQILPNHGTVLMIRTMVKVLYALVKAAVDNPQKPTLLGLMPEKLYTDALETFQRWDKRWWDETHNANLPYSYNWTDQNEAFLNLKKAPIPA